MAVVEKSELIKRVREFLGEAPDEYGLGLMEDLADTLDSNSAGTATREQVEAEVRKEFEERISNIDKEWRKKYADRFESGANEPEPDPDPEPEPETKKVKFEELFKEG